MLDFIKSMMFPRPDPLVTDPRLNPHYRKAMADVTEGMFRAAGLNVEVQSMDWGTAIVRRENKQPMDKGGWGALCTTANGLDMQTPLLHFLRTTGEKAWFGWTNSPKIEELRFVQDDSALDISEEIARLRAAGTI